jgi:hypothetical protein
MYTLSSLLRDTQTKYQGVRIGHGLVGPTRWIPPLPSPKDGL